MPVRPLGNRLVVHRWPETSLTESGLWLPSDAREKPQLGDVLAVGPGVRCHHSPDGDKWIHIESWDNVHFTHQPIDIAVGEVVVFAKMVSRDFEYTVDGERLLILPYSTIYAAVRGLSR